jgi:hypothetical protein
MSNPTPSNGLLSQPTILSFMRHVNRPDSSSTSSLIYIPNQYTLPPPSFPDMRINIRQMLKRKRYLSPVPNSIEAQKEASHPPLTSRPNSIPTSYFTHILFEEEEKKDHLNSSTDVAPSRRTQSNFRRRRKKTGWHPYMNAKNARDEDKFSEVVKVNYSPGLLLK